MIYEIIHENEFANEMMNHGFSYKGALALYEYLEEFSEPIQFDAVALRCEFTEYANIDEILEDYSDIEDMDDLLDYTPVIEFDGGIIIQSY